MNRDNNLNTAASILSRDNQTNNALLASRVLEKYSALLETLYASLWDDKGFENFLRSLQEFFSCASATLMALQIAPRQVRWGWTVGIPDQYERWYIENGKVAEDPSVNLYVDVGSTVEGFVTASTLLNGVPLIEAVNEDFKPWLISETIIDAAGLVIPAASDEHLILALQRNQAAGLFSIADIEQLNLLVPHIKQAVQLFIKFYRQQNHSTSLQSAINTLPQPTIILNDMMEIRHINSAAKNLIAASNTLLIENNKLIINDAVLYNQFMYQAWDMTRACENMSAELNSTLMIPSKNHPITITFSPMFSNEKNEKAKGVLLQIFDPNSYKLPCAEQIQAVFNLSKTEALICELMLEGLNAKEIARRRDVSFHTVREQIRKVFLKTGYNRQSELVAAILRAVQ